MRYFADKQAHFGTFLPPVIAGLRPHAFQNAFSRKSIILDIFKLALRAVHKTFSYYCISATIYRNLIQYFKSMMQWPLRPQQEQAGKDNRWMNVFKLNISLTFNAWTSWKKF